MEERKEKEVAKTTKKTEKKTEETPVGIFATLNAVDVSSYVKQKNGLTYLSWASAWKEVKKRYPDATYDIIKQKMDEFGNERFWHDDGKTGWVETSVTIQGETIFENLAIMDFKNKSIPAENITSVDANKAMKRCLVKCLALHGLGLYIYDGEDLPEEVSKTNEIKEKIKALVDKKIKLGEDAKAKVVAYCKEAQKESDPELEDEFLTGNYKEIDDMKILDSLHKKLLSIRK